MSSSIFCVTCWKAFAVSAAAPNRRTCSICSEKELQMWESGQKTYQKEEDTKRKRQEEDTKRKRHQKEEDTKRALQSSLTFLRLPFENEPAAGTLGVDVSIIVQGSTHQPLHAHKFMLASKSLVFCKMFETDMLEKETGILRIDDASLPVMHAMVKFCYTAEIDFTEKVTAEEVLAVAHKYGIDLLTKLCERHLITTISKESLPKRLKLAKKFEVSDLRRATSEYFKYNFDKVIDGVLDELC